MNKTFRKKSMPADPFSAFKKATNNAFAFLLGYGFRHVSTHVRPPECVIKYRTLSTGVTISYEWGGLPSVVLSKLERTSGEVNEIESIGLKFLIMERCPDKLREDNYSGQNTTTEVERDLQAQAAVLGKYGQDVLSGDFSVFAKLNKLKAEEERKVNFEMYGSDSGETV